MKAFVTGATGFLGSHVARALADQGADLRLLVRPTSNLKNIEGLNAETATGDLRDAASLEKAMSGCDTVFHVAADYRLWVRDLRSTRIEFKHQLAFPDEEAVRVVLPEQIALHLGRDLGVYRPAQLRHPFGVNRRHRCCKTSETST